MPNSGAKRRAAVAALALLVLAAVWLLWYALYTGLGFELLFCPIHKLTGLFCPGCGTMRALAALMRLDLAAAFRSNALVVLALPFLAVAAARSVWLYISTGHGLPSGKGDLRIAAVIGAAAVLFGIARNIPALAFLAP